MKQTKVLVICTHQEILGTVIRLINSNPDMNGTGANTMEQASTLITSDDFDVVLIGAGLAQEEETELVNLIKKLHPNLPIVLHYGGGSGLLFAEIYGALKNR